MQKSSYYPEIAQFTFAPLLQPGDADQDLDFDQLDLVNVQVAATYLSGGPATWGEGDWNAAPGGYAGSPPPGDGRFNQLDIVAALGAGRYLQGPYATIGTMPKLADPATAAQSGPTNLLRVPEPSTMVLAAFGLWMFAVLCQCVARGSLHPQ